jgi:hypothetical protein
VAALVLVAALVVVAAAGAATWLPWPWSLAARRS